MIDLFTKCDAEYGRRVAEGLRQADDEAISSGPIGSTSSDEAVKEAEEKAHSAQPY